MIVLHTLGACSIDVEDRKVLPKTARIFAALLYMVLERGRQIPRAELQAVLFPHDDRTAGAHNLRQLLYKLRRLGIPIVARGDTVALAARHVEADFDSLLKPETVTDEAMAAAMGGFLTGYCPDFSAPYAEWLEDQRVRISHAIRSTLIARLAALRSQGRLRDLGPAAQACLVYDPLNDDAIRALAESLAVTGQKTGAMKVLSDYLVELGPGGEEVSRSVRVLRRRISENAQDTPYRRPVPGRFVGRDPEMTELWVHFQRARSGDARVVVIHGEQGVGKSRLVGEFARAAALDGATCVKAECMSEDARRPLGMFIDLVPKLLDAPGALGVSTQAMDDLRKLTTRESDDGQFVLGAHEPRSVSTAIVRALRDLLEAVAGEQPLVLWIEDGHLADDLSLQVVRGLGADSARREVLVAITSRVRLFTGPGEGHADRIQMLRVSPLEDGPSRALAEDALLAAGLSASPEEVARCVEHAAGNPLYIRVAASDLATDAAGAQVPRSLTQLLQQRIDQLDPRSLRVLAGCAVLGRWATVERLADVVALRPDDLFRALYDLSDRGILDADPTALRSTHHLLADIAVEGVTPSVLQLLHYRIAERLEGESAGLSDAAMLWDCARHWEKANNAPKALALLRSCAAHCVQIGQPQTACELLEHAERIAPPERIEAVLQEAIAAAQAAERFGSVRALIGRYRARRPGAPVHDEYELVEMETGRWEGVPLSDRQRELLACLYSADASPAHRLRAAGMLIIYADGWFDSAVAHEAYRIAQQLRDTNQEAAAAWENVNVVYQMRFGTLAETADAAARALLSSQQNSSPARAVLLASNAAVGFAIAGSLEGARECGTYGFAMAQKNGMRTSAVLCAAILASVHWDFDDREGAMHWDAIADRTLPDVSVLNRALVHVSNKIEFAIAAGDTSAARSWLQFAGTRCAESQCPHNWCIGRGYEMLIHHIEGGEPLKTREIEGLLDWHVRARTSLSHDAFVEGLWRALGAVNRRDTADRLLAEYLLVHRRERHPVRRGLRELAAARPV